MRLGNAGEEILREAEEFDAQDERAVVVLATQAGVAIENARLYGEMQRRERWLDSVREIATATLAGAEAEVVLELIARRARELAGANLATIATPADGEGELRLQAADGMHADELRGLRFPTARARDDATEAVIGRMTNDRFSIRVEEPESIAEPATYLVA